jgi:uncharacterized protein DUF5605
MILTQIEITGTKFQAELIDTWEITITPIQGTFSGKFDLPLPDKHCMAVRIRKVQ